MARPLAQGGIEVRQRLVQQQHARLGRERPGERHPLLLATRELRDAPRAEPLQVHQRERPVDAPVQLGAAHAERLEPEGDIGPDVQVREQGVVLEHHAEPARHRRHPGHVVALDQHPSLVGSLESRQQTQRRRLAAPARSQQRQQLAALESQGDVVDRNSPVEPLHQPVEAKEGAHRPPSRPVPRTWRSQ